MEKWEGKRTSRARAEQVVTGWEGREGYVALAMACQCEHLTNHHAELLAAHTRRLGDTVKRNPFHRMICQFIDQDNRWSFSSTEKMNSEIRPKRSSLELMNRPFLEHSRSFDSLESDPIKFSKLQNLTVSGAVTARPKLESLLVGTPVPAPTTADRCYYTLAIRVQDMIIPHRDDEREDHVHFQVSFSMDGMTSMIKPIRIPSGSASGSPERVNVTGDPVLFQAIGSPSGTLLVVRLFSSNRQKSADMTEVGMTIVDLSLLSVTPAAGCKLCHGVQQRN